MSNTIQVLRSTIAKQSTVPARKLPNNAKVELEPGEYEIIKAADSVNGHQKISFKQKLAAIDGTLYQTWVLWGDDVLIPGERSSILLDKVPYCSQRNNLTEWWRTCNSSTHAMLVEFLKPGSLSRPAAERGLEIDDYYMKAFLGKQDSTVHHFHTDILKQFGIDSEWRMNLNYEDINRQLEQGYPVAVGVLHQGTIANPEGGHIFLINGYDAEEDGYFARDPWGKGFSYSDTNGRNAFYPKSPSLDARWLVNEMNNGHGRIILEVR